MPLQMKNYCHLGWKKDPSHLALACRYLIHCRNYHIVELEKHVDNLFYLSFVGNCRPCHFLDNYEKRPLVLIIGNTTTLKLFLHNCSFLVGEVNIVILVGCSCDHSNTTEGLQMDLAGKKRRRVHSDCPELIFQSQLHVSGREEEWNNILKK
jgi:hypothetical protein